ncbi:MAG: glycosyltransferase family 9 protein [Halobacteriovoraceae bacterium]|jgi:ADP-heptose:LPS heptosyltransferase|nr:glycosyltransferase family 9 protein [Halobacteriovoraceae bacterium]MBT5095113.1 glycosyltransferase family 9 protein [Halobacteriovoraceae bacterium]
MSDILLINFKRLGDIYSSAHLIQSIVTKDPSTKVSILVFKEFELAARSIKNVANVYTVNRKEIETLKKNRIYSNGFALNSFFDDINDIANLKWDQVINYSNDRLSTYLTSLLTIGSKPEYAGIRFTKRQTVEYSSIWSIIFNDVLTSYKYTPVNFNDAYHHLIGAQFQISEDSIKTNAKYNESAFKNFTQLREAEARSGNQIKLVGIQLKTSRASKDIPMETLTVLVNKILDCPELYPILLVAPSQEEKAIANKINEHFDNSLVSVEADLKALPSVLINLDLVITPDTLTKHMADLVDTPVIEVSLGEAPLFKQATVNPQSIVLSVDPALREFSVKKTDSDLIWKNQNKMIEAADILSAVFYLLNENTALNLGQRVCAYQPVRDGLGYRLKLIAGESDPQWELARQLGRCYMMKSLTGLKTDEIFSDLVELPRQQIRKWLDGEKAKVSEASKNLLGAIRSLLQAGENSAKGGDFVRSLDKLLLSSETDSLVSLPSLWFRANIESLNSTTLEENIKEVEGLLYKLKGEYQKVFDLLKDFENFANKERILRATQNPTPSEVAPA